MSSVNRSIQAEALMAGFAAVDITPRLFPVRTYLGLQNEAMDPLYAHACVLRSGAVTVALLSLDVVIVEEAYVLKIRKGVAARCGLPGNRLLVCATHNHACPAVVDRPGHAKEHAYLEQMVSGAVDAVVRAMSSLSPTAINVGVSHETRVSFNRRFILRDGTVVTQPSGSTLENGLLCSEGVIDPEIGVLCFHAPGGAVRGLLVNFACHACHHMGSLSSGFPGVMARRLKARFGDACGVLFLNGACANLVHVDYLCPKRSLDMETVGERLADDVIDVVQRFGAPDPAPILRMVETTHDIAFRDWTALEAAVANPDRFVNVFPNLVELGWYTHSLDLLRALRQKSEGLPAIQQALRLGDAVLTTVPAEFFCENGLHIKRLSPIARTFVVSLANGWLGYIPHPEAFQRSGGHETFPALWSKMEINAGRIMGEKALELIRNVSCNG